MSDRTCFMSYRNYHRSDLRDFDLRLLFTSNDLGPVVVRWALFCRPRPAPHNQLICGSTKPKLAPSSSEIRDQVPFQFPPLLFPISATKLSKIPYA